MIQDLIELCGKKVKGGHDAPVGSQIVLFHNFFVVYSVPDVDIAGKNQFIDSRVEIDDVRRCFFYV